MGLKSFIISPKVIGHYCASPSGGQRFVLYWSKSTFTTNKSCPVKLLGESTEVFSVLFKVGVQITFTAKSILEKRNFLESVFDLELKRQKRY